jgi:hypothetical protein
MKVDSDTVTVIFGLVLNSAGMGALAGMLDRRELQDITSALRDAIKPDRSDTAPEDVYVANKLQPLSRQIFSAWMLLLHLVSIVLLVALAAVLYIGPEQFFQSVKGEQPDPMTYWERLAYWLWYALLIIAYLVKCVTPTIQLFGLRSQAKDWIKDYRERYGINKR